MTAPSMVAGRSLPIQSPARKSPGMVVRTAGRAGTRAPRENVALRSRTTTARRTVASRGRGTADRSSSSASATSSSLLLATTASAPLDTSDRCVAPLAEEPTLVEHPLHGPARQADEAAPSHLAIEPEVDGDDG